MIDAELRKDIKNDPVVEYDIPKRIFTVAPPPSPPPMGGREREEEAVKGLRLVMGENTLTDLWAF